jgi:hypothetical protein
MVFPMRQIMGTHAAEGISVLCDRDLILLFTRIERQSLVFHPNRECNRKYNKLETKRRRKTTDNPRFKLSRKLTPSLTSQLQHPNAQSTYYRLQVKRKKKGEGFYFLVSHL